jgi:hypothetical protein
MKFSEAVILPGATLKLGVSLMLKSGATQFREGLRRVLINGQANVRLQGTERTNAEAAKSDVHDSTATL